MDGLDKVDTLKKVFGNSDTFSVDVSTPINRSIDGAITGKSFSGIYDYNTFKMDRIKEETKIEILRKYHEFKGKKVFSEIKVKEMIESILLHQRGESSQETYNNRARLIILNSDIYRYKTELS